MQPRLVEIGGQHGHGVAGRCGRAAQAAWVQRGARGEHAGTAGDACEGRRGAAGRILGAVGGFCRRGYILGAVGGSCRREAPKHRRPQVQSPPEWGSRLVHGRSPRLEGAGGAGRPPRHGLIGSCACSCHVAGGPRGSDCAGGCAEGSRVSGGGGPRGFRSAVARDLELAGGHGRGRGACALRGRRAPRCQARALRRRSGPLHQLRGLLAAATSQVRHDQCGSGRPPARHYSSGGRVQRLARRAGHV
mmetsp:Transcript_50206/g.160734  ORF Transcript_50206/g.160734 Transcript_50206/m.160734 type:complete len:247 (-) Transcript_50206:2226-2966(-)